MSNIKWNRLEALIIILTSEKIIQHFLTTLFFLVEVPGIGKPDTGTIIHLSYETMSLLNFILFGAFFLGLYGKIKRVKWTLNLIMGLAALDIILEIIFHGFLYITVSVIISTLMIFAIIAYQRKN